MSRNTPNAPVASILPFFDSEVDGIVRLIRNDGFIPYPVKQQDSEDRVKYIYRAGAMRRRKKHGKKAMGLFVAPPGIAQQAQADADQTEDAGFGNRCNSARVGRGKPRAGFSLKL